MVLLFDHRASKMFFDKVSARYVLQYSLGSGVCHLVTITDSEQCDVILVK